MPERNIRIARKHQGAYAGGGHTAADAFITLYPSDDEAYTIRGIKHWAGQRSLAINNYLSAIRINPESRAKMALQAANDILDYYNKDLLNP